MKRKIFNITTFIFLGIFFSISYSAQAQVKGYRVSDRQIQTLVNRIETRTANFRRVLDQALDTSTLNGTSSEDSINSYVSDFERATSSLKDNLGRQSSSNADVQEVLNRAGFIQNFLRDYSLNYNVQQQWNLLKTDLNTLATYYNVRFDWNNSSYPGYPGGRGSLMLTGTYRLNPGQSDNVSTIVDRALGTGTNTSYGNDNRNGNDRIRRTLERRLTAPDVLAIDKRNNEVTIASSLSPQYTVQANGVAQTETNQNGRSVQTTVTSLNNTLEISTQGDRTNDFFITFAPVNNSQLRVTRKLYLENRNQTVTAISVYDKTSQTADFSIASNGNYNNGNGTYNNGNNGNNGQYPNQRNQGSSQDFVIPNGTQIVAVLNNQLSTKTANEGDRFTMTVRTPSQYDGATIEGYLSNTQTSGRITGRAQVTFNFETIRLRNGSSYRFSGLVDQVRQPNGDTVSVNNEGTVKDSSQGNKTAARAGIGAALGAIIGAIAGGGSGAAIGAGIGAGAGAGTVVLQGKDNLDLQSGSEFRITSSAPGNISR